MKLALVIFLMSVSVNGAEYYTASDGTSGGSGAINSPWDIVTALTNSTPQPGDTVWLRGGTYGVGSNVFSCNFVGSSTNAITVRQYPRERAIINGGIKTTGSWTTFWGFEITCTNDRTNTYANRPAALSIDGEGQKAINLVIYNTGHAGIGTFWDQGDGREIHGCIIWGVGIYEYDNVTTFPTNAWTRGSGIYAQNRYGTMSISDTISSRNFTSGMKAYGENGYVNGFIFDGNVVFKNDLLGIEVECLNNSITNCTVINNQNYRSLRNTMGYFGDDTHATQHGLLYTNNYQITYPEYRQSALWLKRWQDVTVVGNTIVTTSKSNEWVAATAPLDGYGGGGNFVEIWPLLTNSMSYTINSNVYHGGVELSPPYQPFRYKIYEPELTFQTWTNTHGFDLDSSYTTNMPLTTITILRTNRYELGRAHLVVINWASNVTTSVNLAGIGLTNGQPFEVMDAQDFLGSPALTANFDSGSPSVNIPLTLTNITSVTGGMEERYKENPNIHTASLFNVFVIRSTGEFAGAAVGINAVNANVGTIQLAQ